MPSPGSLLVPNAQDNSRPGDLTITFSKLLISCMTLYVYQVINYAELVFHMSKMSSAVDCRGSKFITPGYYWPCFFFFWMRLAFHELRQTLLCTSYFFSILFAVISLTSSKSESHSEAVELMLLLQANWHLALVWLSYLQDIKAPDPWFYVWIF